jgi:hypothetical protein
MDGAVNNSVLGPLGYFTERNASDFMFGYKDEMWEVLRAGSPLLNNYSVPTIFRIIFNGTQPAPAPATFTRGQTCPMWDDQSFCNSSAKSTNVIFTGKDDIKTLGQYTEWAGQNKLWWWGSPEESDGGTCQTIQGTNAMNYPPGLDERSMPYVYVDSIFRTVQLQFHKRVAVKDIPALQFTVASSELLTNTSNAKCYFQKYEGIFNISIPYFSPLYVTQPDCWNVPPHQTIDEADLFEGQKGRLQLLNFTVDNVPIDRHLQEMDPSIGDLILRIEPNTGVLLEGRGRIQMNSWLRQIRISDCPDVFPQTRARNISKPVVYPNGSRGVVWRNNSYFPYTMLPIIYLDRTVVIPDHYASYIRNMLLLPLHLAPILGGILISVGVVLMVAVGVLSTRRAHRYKEFPQDA